MQFEIVSSPATMLPQDSFELALEALEDGVALFDADRRMVFANAALRRAAGAGDGFTFGPVGIEASGPARAALARALTAALAAAEGRLGLLPAAGLASLPRAGGRAPWLVRAVPIPARAPGGFRGAMLRLSDGSRRRVLPPASLGRLLGLTPAQAALASALAGGATLDEHARKRGIGRETARSHLAEIRRRTGCRRQSELTALLSRIPG